MTFGAGLGVGTAAGGSPITTTGLGRVVLAPPFPASEPDLPSPGGSTVVLPRMTIPSRGLGG